MKNASPTCAAIRNQSDRSPVPDATVIAHQLGREPVATAVTVRRCARGRPLVVTSPPYTEAGKPFPTLYWLTCPVLGRRISHHEADGLVDELERRVELDPGFRAELLAAQQDHINRRRRLAASSGWDGSAPHFNQGVAGSRNLLHIKCLHAHYADFLVHHANPVGRLVDERLHGWTCARDCAP